MINEYQTDLFTGNAMLLSYDETWKRLIDYYEYHHCIVDASSFPRRR